MIKSIAPPFLNVSQLLNVDLSKAYPLINNLFLIKTKHAMSQKAKTVFRKLDKTDTSQDYSVHFKRCLDYILTNNIQNGSL